MHECFYCPSHFFIRDSLLYCKYSILLYKEKFHWKKNSKANKQGGGGGGGGGWNKNVLVGRKFEN